MSCTSFYHVVVVVVGGCVLFVVCTMFWNPLLPHLNGFSPSTRSQVAFQCAPRCPSATSSRRTCPGPLDASGGRTENDVFFQRRRWKDSDVFPVLAVFDVGHAYVVIGI